jgi:hypothetical protein
MPTRNNYFDLPRPQREVVTEEFADDERPEITETISLRYLNAVEALQAQEKASNYIGRFIDQGEQYAPIGGQGAQLTESLIRQACSIEAMQCGGQIITADELIAMAHSAPSIYLDIVAFAGKINAGYDPKALAEAVSAPSSAPASTGEPQITPSF